MRLIFLSLLALPLLAQENDPKVLQNLLSEVQQLRFAIERSTLLGARTQLAISQLQLQEGRLSKVSQDLQSIRNESSAISGQQTERAEQAKRVEQAKSEASNMAPEKQRELEGVLRQVKVEQDMITTRLTQLSARESEVASQFQQAQAAVNDARGRIAQLEQSLDAAIQQILKPR